ncbi:hypothetical protein [Nocardioides gansuensis]|uniref:hypothetical protein n=1 Tax=Nocardioides gansuensis TaxID=2138300 RepID=UPI001057F450|nr:hypothetical protein [Nocardioides gansuensis]
MDPRRLLPVLAFVAVISVVACLTAVLVSRDRPAATAASPPGPSPRVVLARWDARRSAAWAAGDIAALRRLYAPGSEAGRADARMLRSYAARGLRVEGLTTQVLSLRVASRTDTRLSLVVTDRVAGGEAVGAAGSTPLPVDRATTREVELRLVEGEWVVAEARDAGVMPARATR